MAKMKSILKITIIVFLTIGIISIINSCKKEKVPTLPILSTSNVSGISTTVAVTGGNITTDGGASITVRGVCWALSTNPTAAGSHTSDGSGTGSYASSITGLTANNSPVNETFAMELMAKGIPADVAQFFAAAKMEISKPNDTTCIYLQTFPT